MLHETLTAYLEDALLMEQGSLELIDSVIQSTEEATRAPGVQDAGAGELVDLLERHRSVTVEQVDRLRDHLAVRGGGPSHTKELATRAAALGKQLFDSARSDKPIRNGRDAFAAEHYEIATYELLSRLAARASDPTTQGLAEELLGEELDMARRLADRWDRMLTAGLVAEGVVDPAQQR